MRKLEKIKKNFVINTKFLKKSDFNEPVYVINSGKNFIEVYSTANKKVTIKKLELDGELAEKTFITVKDFFHKCKKDNTEFRIEKVDNGDVYIRVAFLDDLSLFLRLRNGNNQYFLTNINNYKFYETHFSSIDAVNKIDYLNYAEKENILNYLSNFKNIKRDYIYNLKKSLENLEKAYKLQNENKK